MQIITYFNRISWFGAVSATGQMNTTIAIRMAALGPTTNNQTTGSTSKSICPWKRLFVKRWCVTCSKLSSTDRNHLTPLSDGTTSNWKHTRPASNQTYLTYLKKRKLIRQFCNQTRRYRQQLKSLGFGRNWPWERVAAVNGDSFLFKSNTRKRLTRSTIFKWENWALAITTGGR